MEQWLGALVTENCDNLQRPSVREPKKVTTHPFSLAIPHSDQTLN